MIWRNEGDVSHGQRSYKRRGGNSANLFVCRFKATGSTLSRAAFHAISVSVSVSVSISVSPAISVRALGDGVEGQAVVDAAKADAGLSVVVVWGKGPVLVKWSDFVAVVRLRPGSRPIRGLVLPPPGTVALLLCVQSAGLLLESVATGGLLSVAAQQALRRTGTSLKGDHD